MRHRILILLTIALSFGCNSGSGDGGNISLVVKNARGPAAVEGAALTANDALPSELTVMTFRIVVSGDDFSPPIEALFPSDAHEGVIGNIPSGDDRTVLIEALNKDNKAVRRKEVKHVEIKGGETTQVAATLVAVPWLTSVRDGSVMTTSRLILEGYGEPGSGLEITDTSGTSSFSISEMPTPPGQQQPADGSVGNPLITPSLSVGFFSLKPPTLQPGIHTFELRDPQTGESSKVTVTLVPSGRMPGTWVSPMGAVTSRYITTLGMTKPFERGFVLPEVLEQMGNKDSLVFPQVLEQLGK